MLMQNFGVTKEEHCGMLWYFLEWSIQLITQGPPSFVSNDEVSYCVTRHLSETSSTALLDETINFSSSLTGLYM